MGITMLNALWMFAVLLMLYFFLRLNRLENAFLQAQKVANKKGVAAGTIQREEENTVQIPVDAKKKGET